jgi:membrane fusion protein (multidrug efflux system)
MLCLSTPDLARRIRFVAGLIVVGFLSACSEPQAPAPPAPEVEVITVRTKTVPVVINRVAQTESSREVQVVARVSGFLEQIAYSEGDLLQQGDVMFVMDRKPFLADVEAARGELEASEARLWTANANLNRTRPLAEADALSQSDLDQAIGEQKAAEAAVYSARAHLTQAELDLGYATIRAPVTGLSGKASQREGAYLNALGDSANLTYVSQVDPMWVNFSISQNEREKSLRDEAEGKLILPAERMYEFEIVLGDGSVFPHKGTLDFAAPTFDERTGTFGARAKVANPDSELRPGMFVTVRIRGAMRPDAVTVPQEAVLQTSNGHVVWLVNAEGQTESRPVVMGDWVGKDWVVEKGLSGGETVIVGGLNRIRPGTPVKTVPYKGPGASPAPSKSTS